MTLFARFLFLTALLGATVPLSSYAAVIQRDWLAPGDGLLTYDTINQREWLDLTETVLSNFPGETLEERYNVVLGEIMPDGIFEGFSSANLTDVLGLATSAGMNVSTRDFVVNGASAELLTILLGDDEKETGSNLLAVGATDSILHISKVAYVPIGRDNQSAYIQVDLTIPTPGLDNVGVWLFRTATVPEPSAWISTLFIIAYVISKRREEKGTFYLNQNK